MGSTVVKVYRSPSLVLLAFDWADGASRDDFLGFAIRRTPGFADLKTGKLAASDWLPNRLSFKGPPAQGQPDFPSNTAPIQKFMWWDARLEGVRPGDALTYEVFPVCGAAADLNMLTAEGTSLNVTLPEHVEFGIGTWFNRAVMSSQAFSRKLQALGIAGGEAPSESQALELRTWLANGMETPVPDFIAASDDSLVGAIYHLNDTLWIVPALGKQMDNAKIALVYDAKKQKGKGGKVLPNPSQDAIDELKDVDFYPRDKTN